MKCQILFSRKNKKKYFKILLKFSPSMQCKITPYFYIVVILLTLKVSIPTEAEDNFDFSFIFYLRKQVLTFHVNHLL